MTDFKNYVCTGCTYRCRTMAGFGKNNWSEGVTCVCENKNVLVEITTKIYPGVNQGILDIIKRGYRQCPYCHDQEYHRWPKNHPCPKCGQKMITETEMEAKKELEKPSEDEFDYDSEEEELAYDDELKDYESYNTNKKNTKGLGIGITFEEKEKERYEVYLINDSDVHYTKVEKIIGGYVSQDEGPPAQMDSFTLPLGELMPRSFIHIGSGSLWNLEFHLWTHFLFTPKKGKKFKLWYEIGGTFYYDRATRSLSQIPILEKIGTKESLLELK